MKCRHDQFEANVGVYPLQDGPTSAPIDLTKPPDRYFAEVTIKCATCGELFQFLGPETGLSFTKPTVDFHATTLHIPIAPGKREVVPSRITFEVPSSEKKS